MRIVSYTTTAVCAVRDISQSSSECTTDVMRIHHSRCLPLTPCSGHAGKHAAEWCGQNFHEVSEHGSQRRGNSPDSQYLMDATLAHPDHAIPDLLNKTFQVVDSRLSHLAQAGKTQSGCTAVTAFLRVEQDLDAEPKGFTNPGLTPRGLMEGKGEDELEAQTSLNTRSRESSMGGGTSGSLGGASDPGNGGNNGLGRKMSGRRIRDFVKGLTSSGSNDDEVIEEPAQITAADGSRIEAIEAKGNKPLKRVLYTANVGDARAVLWQVSSFSGHQVPGGPELTNSVGEAKPSG